VAPRAVAGALAAGWGVLAVAHVVVVVGLRQLLRLPVPAGLAALVDVNGEGNLPAWYQTALLLACAAGLAALGSVRPRSAPRGPVPDRWAWRGLAAVFLYLALDEALQVHERTVPPLRRLAFGGTPLEDVGWVVPAAGLCVALGVALLRFLAHLPGPTRRAFAAAGALYLAGALGLEVAGGWWSFRFGYDSPGFGLLAAAEETLEAAGLLVFLHALLGYAAAAWGPVLVTISDRPAPPAGGTDRAERNERNTTTPGDPM